jgi:peptide/nickel transport system substrate-binding protein
LSFQIGELDPLQLTRFLSTNYLKSKMKYFNPAFLFLISLSLFSINCSKNNTEKKDIVIIGISSDIQTLNPLYAFNINEGYITGQLYLSLVQHGWNSEIGEMDSEPMLAKSLEWNSDSTTITIQLRNDAMWSDSVNVTAEDVVYSFDLYSDPEVDSRFLGTFKNFYADKDNHIDLKKTFEIISPYILKIHFLANSVPSLYNIDLPILPKHVFEKIARKDIEHSEVNFHPVTDGAFRLSSWERNQAVILKANQGSFLHRPNSINEIIFKIVPDYSTRLLQLKNGELDLITDLNPDDAEAIKAKGNIDVVPIKGREYDYIGWDNIDPHQYSKNKKLVPNPLFGNANIRKALTYALNRNEVVKNYLYNHGEIAVGPVSPIFKSIYDSSLVPYEYNPEKARKIFASEGWVPSPGDGILEKNGKKFSFKLYMGTGNARRDFAMSIFKNNLKAVGVDVQIEKMEMSSFLHSMFSKQFDAWTAGWTVSIPIDIMPFWYSHLDVAMLNISAYNNSLVDQLLSRLQTKITNDQKIETYKKIQKILHDDEPVTFLYWVDKIVAYNNRIKNIDINPLGAINTCWEWEIK